MENVDHMTVCMMQLQLYNSSVPGGSYALRKARERSTQSPMSQMFPPHCLCCLIQCDSFSVCLIDDGPLSSFEGRFILQ